MLHFNWRRCYNHDISAGLQIPVQSAEDVKIKDGNALFNLMERDRNISLPSGNEGFGGKIIRAVTLNTIIRLECRKFLNL